MFFLELSCESPDVLRVIYFLKLLLDLAFVIVPIGLIVLLMVDMGKAVISNSPDDMKKYQKLAIRRAIVSMSVFSVPTIVGLVVGVVNETTGYMSCLANANMETIEKYQAVKDLNEEIEKTQNEQANKKKSEEAMELAVKELDLQREQAKQLFELAKENGTSEMTGTSTSDNYEGGQGETIDMEPEDPTRALAFWYQKDNDTYAEYNPANFSVMKDKDTGYSLGLWPKDADVSNLSPISRKYQNGLLIFPVDGDGSKSYDHNGIDILTEIGTPVYAPCDGTLRYSEWGHTINEAATETAYSVSILMKTPFSYTGKWSNGISESGTQSTDTVKIIYMTHMIGIKNRQATSGMEVKQGDLIGFTGIANSVSHLHMTFYDGNSARGLYTPEIQKIYDISGSKKAGA